MKKIIAAIATLVLVNAVAGAQDIKSGFELLKAGSESFAENKEQALNQFKEALGIFEGVGEVTDEEQKTQLDEYKAQCKSLIVKSILGLAKENLKEANYDKALELLGKTIASGTEYGATEDVEAAKELIPATYKQKANSLMKAQDYTGAIEVWKQLIEMNPEDGASYLVMGQAYMKNNDLDGAIEALGKASELGQADKTSKLLSTCYLKKGQALMKAGKNAEAIEALQSSNTYVESANAYKLMASIYTKSGKSSEAIETYKKYLDINPNAKDAADIIFTIAATAQKSGDKATAKEYYTKLKGNPKYGAQADAQLKTL